MCVCFHFIKNVPLFVDTPPFRGLMKQNKCRMESVELGHFRARREAIVVTPAGGGPVVTEVRGVLWESPSGRDPVSVSLCPQARRSLGGFWGR